MTETVPQSLLLDLMKGAGRALKARRGQTVIARDAEAFGVFLVEKGWLSVTLYSAEGREVVVRELGPGEMFGELAALDQGGRSASVVATEECRLVSVSRESFLSLLLTQPAAALELSLLLARQMRAMTDKVFELSMLSAGQRLQCELLRLASPEGADAGRALIPRMPSQEDMASRIGVRRESVSRELQTLTRAGIIEQTGRSATIKDLKRLRQLVADAYGASPHETSRYHR